MAASVAGVQDCASVAEDPAVIGVNEADAVEAVERATALPGPRNAAITRVEDSAAGVRDDTRAFANGPAILRVHKADSKQGVIGPAGLLDPGSTAVSGVQNRGITAHGPSTIGVSECNAKQIIAGITDLGGPGAAPRRCCAEWCRWRPRPSQSCCRRLQAARPQSQSLMQPAQM